MKRILTLVLAALMVLSLAACGNASNAKPDSSATATTDEPGQEPAETDAAEADTEPQVDLADYEENIRKMLEPKGYEVYDVSHNYTDDDNILAAYQGMSEDLGDVYCYVMKYETAAAEKAEAMMDVFQPNVVSHDSQTFYAEAEDSICLARFDGNCAFYVLSHADLEMILYVLDLGEMPEALISEPSVDAEADAGE